MGSAIHSRSRRLPTLMRTTAYQYDLDSLAVEMCIGTVDNLSMRTTPEEIRISSPSIRTIRLTQAQRKMKQNEEEPRISPKMR